MEGPERYVKSVVLESPPTHKAEPIPHHCGVCPGCESWTLTHTLQKSLDGCYTRMLRAVLNVDQNIHITNEDLYGQLPRKKVAARRMRLAGHCHRHRELPASRLDLWEATRGHRSRGRSALTYVDVLKKYAGAESSSELAGCMENREDWRLRWKLV